MGEQPSDISVPFQRDDNTRTGEPELPPQAQTGTGSEKAKTCHTQGTSNSAMPACPPLYTWPQVDRQAFHGLAGEVVHAMEPYTEADPIALLGHLLAEFSCIVGPTPYIQLDGSPCRLAFWPVMVGETSKGRKGSATQRIRRRAHLCRPSIMLSSPYELLSVLIKRDPDAEDPGIPDKRLYLVQSEFGSMLKVMAREGNSLSGVVRDAWDGEDLAPMTKNSRIRATAPHVVIVGHVTKEDLRKHLREEDKSNGFGNRFVWFMVKRSKLQPFASGVPEHVLGPLREGLRDAVAYAQTVGEVALSEEGKLAWASIYESLSQGRPGVAGALVGRGEAQVRQVAALYALLDQSPVVTDVHLSAALALWRFAEESVAWIFADMATGELCEQILGALMNGGPLDESAISALFHNNVPAAMLEDAKQALKRAGYIFEEIIPTNGRPRRQWKWVSTRAA